MSNPPCGVIWCRAAHGPGDHPGHSAVFGLWKNGGATVELFAGQIGDNEPIVRINWTTADRACRTRDLAPELAAEIGELLALLGFRDVSEFGAALRRAGKALDS